MEKGEGESMPQVTTARRGWQAGGGQSACINREASYEFLISCRTHPFLGLVAAVSFVACHLRVASRASTCKANAAPSVVLYLR